MDLKEIFDNIDTLVNKEVEVNGWIRNHRRQKDFGFIDFSDGTCNEHLQIVYDDKISNFSEVQKMLVGCAIEVKGNIVESQGNQDYELKASTVTLLGDCPADYPIQPKRHTREFLREVAYLRPRTNLFQAVFRVRSVASYAIHKYFQERGYVYFHAPLLTASDCEGAGEMFQVTTLDLNRVNGKPDYSKDFFGKQANLTVSGQLEAETFALAYKKTYTFGPTFRAENSNTKTHANEFWMIEPEMAFTDLNGDMDVMEDMLKYVVSYVLENASLEIDFFDQFVEKGLKEKKYFWNAGMFIFNVDYLINNFKEKLPSVYQSIQEINKSDNYYVSLRKNYNLVEKISFDYGIMERNNEVYVLPTNFGWDDIGTWSSLERYLPKDDNQNIIKGKVELLNSRNCIVYTNTKKIMLIDMENIYCIDSDDILIIGPKEKINDVPKQRKSDTEGIKK